MSSPLRFYRVGDCLILSEQSPFCAVPFDLDTDGKAVVFYEGDAVFKFTPEAFLKWQTGLTDCPLRPEKVFLNQSRATAGLEHIKSLSLRLAVRIDSNKAANGLFVAIARTTQGEELARFEATTEAEALKRASDAFTPPKGMGV